MTADDSPPNTHPGATYRATASVPPQGTPAGSERDQPAQFPDGSPRPSEARRPGPFPPGGPLPPRSPSGAPGARPAPVAGSYGDQPAPQSPYQPPEAYRQPDSYGQPEPYRQSGAYDQQPAYGEAQPRPSSGGPVYPPAAAASSPWGPPPPDGYDAPGYGAPGYGAPAGDLGAHGPAAHDPAAHDPAAHGPAAHDPAAHGPGATTGYASSVYGTPPAAPTSADPAQHFGGQPQFGASAQAPAPVGPPAKRRRGLIIGLVLGAVLLLLAIAATGITFALNRSGADFAVDSCVKRDGDTAVKASCTEEGAYTVVSKVAQKEDCPDQGEPFVVLERDSGADQVLCLRPASR